MKYKSLKLFFLFSLLLSLRSFSQPISKSEFRQLFTQGNLMMLEQFYDTAAKVFLKLNNADPSNANINYKLGMCYLNTPGQKGKAIPYLENSLKQTAGNYEADEPTEKNAPEIALYHLGQAYHATYRFDEAMVQFKKYRDIIGKWNTNLVKEVDHHIEMSKNAKDIIAKPVECTITNLGDSINCQFADYSPVISADESVLSFTSRRLGTGGAANKTPNDEFLEDIWLSNRGPYGTWTKAKSISRSINTENNEATIGLSADGQELYVYRDDGGGDGNIYKSTLDGEYWNAPAKIDAGNINSKKWEPSACVSADGNTMYFVSDREGGLGGRDIYQSKRLPDKSWGPAENLGPSINTPYDEDAPFIHPDGVTFFFSSTGHSTIGGFDVFYSTKVAGNVWTTPINMGYPINTTDDDIYFVTSSDGRRAYYASFRPEGKGEKDIYMVSMPKAFVKSVAILVGYLKNRDGSPIPKNSMVTTKSAKGEVVSHRPNEASGKFVQSLFPGQEYSITIEANGNKVFSDKFFLPQDSSYQNLGRGFFQRTIYIGDTVSLFSTQKPADTSRKLEATPVDGQILLSQNVNDPAKNLTIQLLNSQGNIIASAITDQDGKFKFQNVPSDQKYIIKIDENDPMLKTKDQFYLADGEGKIILPSVQEGKFFLFKNISPELNKMSSMQSNDPAVPATSVMTGKLATDKKGNSGLANATINLKDESGKVIQKKVTDKAGNFSFEGLANDKNYTISIDENDPSMSEQRKLFLINQREALVRKVAKLGDFFIFENLPTDLNKLSALEMADSVNLVSMKGTLSRSANSGDALANLDVKLVDSKGKVIQQTKTDASGGFRFDELSPDKNYTIKFKDNDPLLAGLSKAYLSNEADKTVKIINLNNKESSFKNLPADLMSLGEIRETDLSRPAKTTNEVVAQTLMNPEDKNFDFVVYFPYNKKEIDISVGSFVSLTDKVVKAIKENGSATIIIAASSSSVPTSKYPSNEALAETRANEVKDKVRASVSLKNIDDTKLSYEISKKVQGPEYKNDAVQNRKEYEKWQFVKVIVK